MRVSNLSLPNSLERTYSCAYSMESYEGIDDDFDWCVGPQAAWSAPPAAPHSIACTGHV